MIGADVQVGKGGSRGLRFKKKWERERDRLVPLTKKRRSASQWHAQFPWVVVLKFLIRGSHSSDKRKRQC